MSHKSIARTKKAIRRAKYDVAELRALIMFINAMLKSMGHGTTARVGRRKGRRGAKHHKKGGRKLSVGVHRHVKVGKHFRDVRVMANGKWRFI